MNGPTTDKFQRFPIADIESLDRLIDDFLQPAERGVAAGERSEKTNPARPNPGAPISAS